jgi:hypothetical protein
MGAARATKCAGMTCRNGRWGQTAGRGEFRHGRDLSVIAPGGIGVSHERASIFSSHNRPHRLTRTPSAAER